MLRIEPSLNLESNNKAFSDILDFKLNYDYEKYINQVVKLCDEKKQILDKHTDNLKVQKIIFEYCKENNVFIDSNYDHNSYILYSFNPLIDANNLCNLIYPIKNYIKLATLIYQDTFCLYDFYNQLVIIKKVIISDKERFNKLNNTNTSIFYPDIIQAIFYFSEIYKPKNYKLEIKDKTIYNKMYNSIISYYKPRLEEYVKTKEIININIPYCIRRYVFNKFKKSSEQIIFLDYYAYKYNKKKNYSYMLNIIYNNPESLVKYLNHNKLHLNFYYKKFTNIHLDDFRFVKYNVFCKYRNNEYLIACIFNNTSYELIPCYIHNYSKYNQLTPHPFIYNKFLILYLLNIIFYSNISLKQLYFQLYYYQKFNKKQFNHQNLTYIGTYEDINNAKKTYNSNRNITNYIPIEYIKIHNNLRTFN